MLCQFSIWRWSPFFGICKSKLIGASGCTTYGGNFVASAPGCASISFCQCASGPSPRQETIPIPVIQASRSTLAIGGYLDRQSNPRGGLTHPPAYFFAGEFKHAQCERGVADDLAVNRDAGLGNGVARSIMHQARADRNALAGRDESTEFGVLDLGQKRHA